MNFSTMSRNAFSALDMSDDDEEEVQLSNRIGSKSGKKGPGSSSVANSNPVTNKPNRGVKSEKSVNKNRGGRAPGTTRRREKDRHVSGTGRGKGVKKGGAGAHNWGTGTENVEGDNNENDPDQAEDAENEEEYVPGISYDEWQAQQQKNTNSEAFKALEKPSVRSDFKGAKVLKKTEGEAILLPEGQKKQKKKKKQVRKQFIDANITVNNGDSGNDRPPRRDRRNGGGRGGRGNDRSRGRGGRGGRSGRGQGIKLNNANEFPALG